MFEKLRVQIASAIAPKAEGISLRDVSGALELFGGDASGAGVHVTERSAMQLTAVYASIRILSSVVAGLDMKVCEIGPNGFPKAVNDHGLNSFLGFPNEAHGAFTWREMLGNKMHSQGDGICFLNRDSGMKPRNSFVLDRQNISDVRLRNGRLEYLLTPDPHAEMPHHQWFDQDSILHVPGPGFDGLRTPSPITHFARETLGLALATQRFQKQSMEQGGKPSGALEIPDGVSDEAAQRFADDFDSKFMGTANAGKTVKLWGGAKFTPISFSSVDAEILATRRFEIAEISRIYGVPLHMLSETEKATSWGSGLQEQSIGFVRFVLMPIINRIESEFTRKLFKESERGKLFVRAQTQELQRGTPDQQAKTLDTLVQKAALKTPNEGRAELGLPPVEGGDQLRSPTGAPKQEGGSDAPIDEE